MSEPRTAAGRALLDYYEQEEGLPDWQRETVTKLVLAIEAEAQLLRPRWHHDKSLSPEDRQYCEDCDDLVRRAEKAEAAAAPGHVHAEHTLSDALEGLPRWKFSEAGMVMVYDDNDGLWLKLSDVRALVMKAVAIGAVVAAPATSPLTVEAIAAIEHEQWIEWSQTIAREGLTPERIARWQRYWVPYADLDEATKEHDRKWARKALAAAPERGDVERLARALDDVGRWRKHDPQNIQYCRAYAALLIAAYDAEGLGAA